MIHRIIKQIFRASFLLLLVAAACVSCKQTDSFDRLRLRYYDILATPDADITDSIVKSRIEVLDAAVEKMWQTMEKAPDKEYVWESDKRIPFSQDTILMSVMSSRVNNSFSNLSRMSLAYRTKGSKFENNSELKKDILNGLDKMLAHAYNPSVKWYDNWWHWVIGSPMVLDNLLVLMYDELSKEQIDKAIECMNNYAPNVTYEGASTGANKIWQCKNMILRGIIGKNAEQIKMGIDGLDTEFKYVTTHDGFYRDGSFVQHQWHAYTGGYGRSMLRELAEIIIMVHDSEWAVPENHQTMLYEWIHNSYEPVVYRGALMDMIRGREASRPESDRGAGHSLLVSLVRLSEVAPEAEKKHLQSFVKANILADYGCRPFLNDAPTYLLPTVKKILNDPSIVPAEPRTLNRIFAAMDRVVHIRPGFALGLSMSSSRIENYETINGENLRGWYTGDGMTYLYDNDLQQYGDDFWPTVNAYRIAGTTEDTRSRKAETLPLGKDLLYADGYKSPKDWVGGSSICDAYGMVGMWYSAQDCSLEAKKSWFMVGDEIVALGTGINSKDNRDIETTVEDRKMNDGGAYRFQADGKDILSAEGRLTTKCRWAHFEGVNEKADMGYYFPETPSVNILRETRTGSWFEINQPNCSKAPINKSYFTMWINHGKNPANGTYAYVLLPGKSAAETGKYAENPNIAVLSNTPKVQAVKNKSEGVTGWNFWEASSQPVAGASVDAPASVIVKETDTELIVGVSDPTQKNTGAITVELTRPVAGVSKENPDIKVLSTSPTLKMQVNVSGAIGCTRGITLKK